jgi:hypothetical protein
MKIPNEMRCFYNYSVLGFFLTTFGEERSRLAKIEKESPLDLLHDPDVDRMKKSNANYWKIHGVPEGKTPTFDWESMADKEGLG